MPTTTQPILGHTKMNSTSRAKLEQAGYVVGSADEFLGLTEVESTIVSIRLALAGLVKARRCQRGISQVELARHLKSSQSRVAKMESADSTVSVDLLLRAAVTVGARRRELASAFAYAK